MWMESNSSLPKCKKAGMLLQPIIVCVFSCRISLLKCDTDMVASYHVVPYLQRCYALLVTSNAVHNYWKMLHKHCNTDMLRVLLIYPHSPSGAARPWDHAYISVKPLSAVLQPINTNWYQCVYLIKPFHKSLKLFYSKVKHPHSI